MWEIARSYLRGRSTVSNIIRETCNAIWEALLPRYMCPPTAEEWVRIKQQFNEKLVKYTFCHFANLVFLDGICQIVSER